MSARVEIDASGSTVVLPPYSWGVGTAWGYGDERRVEVDLRLTFAPEDAAIAERELDKAIARARADLGRFQI